jgi:PleD family two-component response regulator
MRTLIEDGIAKAAQGLTTLEAVLQVAAPDQTLGADDESRNTGVAMGVSSHGYMTPDISGFAPIAASRPTTESPEEKPRVLVVEDDPTIISVVKYFLELEGFAVVVAANGLDGIEMAKRELPQIIVADVYMPGMDGMAMLKVLRADARTCDIAVLMLTSEESVESETLALSLGADDYLLKPVEPRRLAARVKALLVRAKAKQPA